MLLADCHMHSLFSTDSEAPMEEMVEAAAAKGLETICFTEHLDYDYPKQPGEEGPPDFLVDLPAYQKALFELKERYRGRVEVLFGLEMGVVPYLGSRCSDVARSFPFDFVLASSHLVDGRDPYYPSYFEGISEEEGYEAYFRTIPANLAAFPDFHSYAHLDYIVRYGPRRNEDYSFEKYREVLTPALRALIDAGKALEVNTGGYKYGLGQPNPQADVLRAYRAMGGELITVGSDAHKPEHVAYDFPRLAELLREIGFRYYAVFRGGKPDMRRL